MNEEMRKGDLAPGTVIGGKYEILGVSGRGGMSTIYRARDKKVGRICAVKQITDRDRESCERHKMSLLTERELLAGLTNPRIPRITDIVEDEGEDDFFYVVMDFLEGENLQHYLSRTGPQQEEQVVAWAKTLCGILKYLHTPEREREAIIFRDVKPGNIMLRRDGDLALFDFGIAAETEDGSLVNEDVAFTPGYAAPEQMVRGARIDRRTICSGAGRRYLRSCRGRRLLKMKTPRVSRRLCRTFSRGFRRLLSGVWRKTRRTAISPALSLKMPSPTGPKRKPTGEGGPGGGCSFLGRSRRGRWFHFLRRGLHFIQGRGRKCTSTASS